MPKRTSTVMATILLLGTGQACRAGQPAPVPNDLQIADISACRKPSVKPPPPVKESYENYNLERRYLDLDGSGQCVVMDIWVERIGGNPSPGMRTLNHRYFHFVGGKWTQFEMSLNYFPFLLTSASTGQRYLIASPDEELDDMAVSLRPTAYMSGRWTNDPGMVPTYSLLPVDQGRSLIYRTLAERLAQRTGPDSQTPNDQTRIRALLWEAAEVDAGISAAPLR